MSGIEAVNLCKKLIVADVLSWQSLFCDNCGEENKEPCLNCFSCSKDISDHIKFQIDGCIKEEYQYDFLAFPELKAQALRFATNVLDQGFMYYMLLDLAESENIQKQSSPSYNEFLDIVRELMKREALSQAKDGAICFGEIGDCLKLAFLTADDIITTVKSFSMVIHNEKLEDRFPGLKGVETIFPRFDGTVGKLSLSKKYYKPEALCCITLNGAIDFNDYELTKLFRLDRCIKTNKLFFDNETVVSLWIQDEIVIDLNWENIPNTKVTDDTHNSLKEGKFALIGFKKSGEVDYADEPSKHNKY